MANFGSGIDAQLGLKEEATPGTGVVPDHFYEIIDSSLVLTPTFIESDGIRAGDKFRRSSQVGISKYTTGGDVTFPYSYKRMGQLWRLALGSPLVQGANPGATPVLVAGAAFQQILIPGGMKGISSTIEVGKPEPASGSVYPFTYTGNKVTGWEFSVTDGAEATLKLTFDGWNETVGSAGAVTAASFTANNKNWNFAQATSFKLGGTAATTAGKVNITGGTAISAVVTSLTLTGSNNMATERYGLGNAGIKKEQLENDFCEITGSFEAELDVTNLYTPFKQGTISALELDLVGAANSIDAGHAFTHTFVMPAIEFTEASAEVSGPDILTVKGSFKVYDDGVNAPFQVWIQTSETTL